MRFGVVCSLPIRVQVTMVTPSLARARVFMEIFLEAFSIASRSGIATPCAARSAQSDLERKEKGLETLFLTSAPNQ